MATSSPASSVLRPLLVGSAALALGLQPGCTRDEGAAPAATTSCAQVVRVPGKNIQVMSLKLPGKPTPVPARCANARCLRTHDDALAILQPDGSVWATWPGQPATIFSIGSLGGDAGAASPLTWILAEMSAATADAPPPPQPPALPAELRTCGTTQAGGGFGWHVIRNADNVWQRVHWTRPPLDKEVVELPANAYPLADGNRLCAYALQPTPRNWEVHLLKTQKVIVAARDREHPPARCLCDGVEVEQEDGSIRVTPDGVEVPVAEKRPHTPSYLSLRDVRFLTRPRGELSSVLANGSPWSFTLPEGGRNLAGKLVAPEATRERLVVAGNGVDTFLAAERLRLPGCGTHEALHLLHADRTVTTLQEGDTMFLRMVFAQGSFYWLHAEPRVVDLSRDDSAAVEF
ncbi:MAG: hypothetical protein AB2A00_22400 [Myxococcota bacterium]